MEKRSKTRYCSVEGGGGGAGNSQEKENPFEDATLLWLIFLFTRLNADHHLCLSVCLYSMLRATVGAKLVQVSLLSSR